MISPIQLGLQLLSCRPLIGGGSFCERLVRDRYLTLAGSRQQYYVFITLRVKTRPADLLRKSTPEGLVEDSLGVLTLSAPREQLPQNNPY